MAVKRSTIEVSGRPDRNEYEQILFDITDARVNLEFYVEECVRMEANALADWLSKAEPASDGARHGAIDGGLVLSIEARPESVGSGVAEGVTEPAHLALYIKASAEMLRTFSEYFEMPVKNG